MTGGAADAAPPASFHVTLTRYRSSAVDPDPYQTSLPNSRSATYTSGGMSPWSSRWDRYGPKSITPLVKGSRNTNARYFHDCIGPIHSSLVRPSASVTVRTNEPAGRGSPP